MIKFNEVYESASNRGYMFLETLKRHDFELGKGNYVVIKRDKKYLLKAFSGFKRKHLKSEFEIRQKLKGIEFPGVDFNEFFESCNFTYLSIPYIWNNGNLEGREEKFFKEINEILIRFHSIPKELFFDRNSYRIFNKNLFSEEKYPYSFKNLNQNAKGDIKRLFLKEVGRLKKFGKKPSHNDFNGDNLLLSRSGNIFITDFETCYLNFELEDLSKNKNIKIKHINHDRPYLERVSWERNILLETLRRRVPVENLIIDDLTFGDSPYIKMLRKKIKSSLFK